MTVLIPPNKSLPHFPLSAMNI